MPYRGFSGGGFVGNFLSTTLLEQLRPAADNAGRQATVGDPSTRAAPYRSDGESWKAVALIDGTTGSLVDGAGNTHEIPYSDGTRQIFRLPSGSWLQLGVTAQGTGKELVNFTQLNTNSEAVSRPSLMFVDQGVNPSATGTVDWHSGDFRTYGGGSNANFTANSGFYALEGKTLFTGTAGQTMGKTVGVFGSSLGTGSSHTLSVSIGVQGETQQTGAGTTTQGRAFSAKSPTVSAGQITTAYGFYAEDILAGLTNYAVYTNAGRVRFHSNVAVPAGGSATAGIEMSSTASLGVFFGSGAPTLSAAQGSLYMRTDGSSTSNRMYVNTNGSTGWTAVTTAT